MNAHNGEAERRRDAAAIGIWDNEGGAPGRNSTDHRYGRRIEADQSSTVRRVFTGTAARPGGNATTGSSRPDATSDMLPLEFRNIERRNGRIMPPFIARKVLETAERRS